MSDSYNYDQIVSIIKIDNFGSIFAAFFYACRRYDIDTVEKLYQYIVENTKYPNIISYNDNACLEAALDVGNINVARWLYFHCDKINDHRIFYFFTRACNNDRTNVVEFLIETMAYRPNENAFNYAVMNGAVKITKYIYAMLSNIDLRANNYGIFVQCHNKNILQWLIEQYDKSDAGNLVLILCRRELYDLIEHVIKFHDVYELIAGEPYQKYIDDTIARIQAPYINTKSSNKNISNV